LNIHISINQSFGSGANRFVVVISVLTS